MNPTDKNRERAEEVANEVKKFEFHHRGGEVFSIPSQDVMVSCIQAQVQKLLDSKDQEHSLLLAELREAIAKGLYEADFDKVDGKTFGNTREIQVAVQIQTDVAKAGLEAFDLCLANQKARKEGKG